MGSYVRNASKRNEVQMIEYGIEIACTSDASLVVVSGLKVVAVLGRRCHESSRIWKTYGIPF